MIICVHAAVQQYLSQLYSFQLHHSMQDNSQLHGGGPVILFLCIRQVPHIFDVFSFQNIVWILKFKEENELFPSCFFQSWQRL